MSDSPKKRPEREWRLYLHDMIHYIEKAMSYTKGMSRDEFETNELIYDATVRNLELIGEAATNIPQFVRDQVPHVPWRQIIATRNKLIHGYAGIDNDILWSIIKNDMSDLLGKLNELKNMIPR
ncbi:MAG: DUF86 domain-containing protein [Magnetococcales bacterium]|nr:DUF86 domain-containing protein [Magnetococcales bacterium]